jgi:hypothetical protein
MEKRDPDTRLVQNLEHGPLDAVLVDSYTGEFPWTVAETTPGDTVSAQDVQLLVQRQLSETLQKEQSLKDQRLGDDRLLMQYIAAEAVEKSAKAVHLRQRPAKEFIEWLHSDLVNVAQSKSLLTAHPHSRLWEKGNHVSGTNGVDFWVQPLKTGRHDPKLLEYFIGKNPKSPQSISHLQSIIEEATGTLLTELDRTHVHIYEEEYRTAVWNLLAQEQGNYPSESLRTKLQTLTIDTWAEKAPDIFHMTALQDQISHTSPINIEDDDISKVIDVCFTPLLSQEEPSPETLDTLRERLVILEFLTLRSAETNAIEDLLQLQAALIRIQKLLQLKGSEYPQIAYTEMVIACKAIDTTVNRLKTVV